MKKSDAEFMTKLKHELLTQPTDMQAAPRHWGIIEEKKIFGMHPDAADDWRVFDCSSCCVVGNENDLESVVAEFVDPDGYNLGDEEEFDCLDVDEVVERANELMDSTGSVTFEVQYYRTKYIVNPDHVFLTKKACLEHIEKYGYNYSEPKPYALTAYRCPEYERLLKIITETDWEAMG